MTLLLASCGGAGRLLGREQAPPECARHVEVLPSADHVHRNSELVRRISASCAKARACERQLKARACELHADAVIVDLPVRHSAGSDPQLDREWQPVAIVDGRPIQHQPVKPAVFVQSGVAVRWVDRAR